MIRGMVVTMLLWRLRWLMRLLVWMIASFVGWGCCRRPVRLVQQQGLVSQRNQDPGSTSRIPILDKIKSKDPRVVALLIWLKEFFGANDAQAFLTTVRVVHCRFLLLNVNQLTQVCILWIIGTPTVPLEIVISVSLKAIIFIWAVRWEIKPRKCVIEKVTFVAAFFLATKHFLKYSSRIQVFPIEFKTKIKRTLFRCSLLCWLLSLPSSRRRRCQEFVVGQSLLLVTQNLIGLRYSRKSLIGLFHRYIVVAMDGFVGVP
mmetsp:Transcript_28402/g.66461  ORF Transcript_28402/g.66461 Transcript_28402/m.66461 type:complete len:259 (-) Transcript_28402:7-783(-)